MQKTLSVGALSLFLCLQSSALMAEESVDRQEHHPAPTQQAPAGGHAQPMEAQMANMSVEMEAMKQEMAQAEERMTAMKGVMEKVRATPPGADRDQLLTEHGAGLRAIMTGQREHMEKMMAKMEQTMKDKEKMGNMAGKPHDGEKKPEGGMGMMGQGMMGDMTGHHELMKKRMALMSDLLGQMDAHLTAISPPR
ncbi:MAG: hypothetical protein HQL07_04860 [Nitrospirae bacterium]|nr:hypothetical protein [Magnetococcales bacterium]HAT49126.1 hypothetical protein [Alphaproteobacteria bacterium]